MKKENVKTCVGALIITFSVSIERVAASERVEKAGDILQVLIPSMAYATTHYLDDRDGQVQFYKSFSANFLATHGLKSTIGKKRPNDSSKSFPSGHTSAAFQGAAFLHKRYGFKYSAPAYIAASFVGYSRIKSDKHYFSDVVAGAALGVVSNYFFTKPYKGFNLTPTASPESYGISLTTRW